MIKEIKDIIVWLEHLYPLVAVWSHLIDTVSRKI